MERFYSSTLKKKVQQINVTRARKLFEQGETIYLMPNKMRFDNSWQSPYGVNKGDVSSWYNFSMICDTYRTYNCGCGRGAYIHFFVEC